MISTKNASRTLCALLCLTAAATAQQPDRPALPDGPALLDRMESRELDSKPKKSMIARGSCEFVVRGMGDEGQQGKYEECYQGDQVHSEHDFGGFFMREGTDGVVAWKIDPMNGVVVLDGEERATTERIWGLGRGDSWRTHFKTAKCTGETEINGVPCYALELQPKLAGGPETWYVDKESLDLAGIDLRMHTPGGKEDVEVRFTDWRDFGGERHPKNLHIRVQHADIYYRLSQVLYDTDIPASRFALPAEVQSALGDETVESAESAVPAEPAEDDDELEVEINQISKRPVASIEAEVTEDKMGETLAVIIPEVMNHMMEQGQMPMGPPFTRYHRISGTTMRIEAGFPLPPRTELAETDRIKMRELPGGKVAVCWHYGHYEKIGETQKLFEAWARKQHMDMSDVRWEIYWTDPGREPDPSKWRTQLFWMVKDAAKQREKKV